MLPPSIWAVGWIATSWKWVEANNWELTLSFLQRLVSFPVSLLAEHSCTKSSYLQVQFSAMNLLQFYCYPCWEFQHHCLYALIGINNCYSSPDSASAGLVTFSDLNSLIIVFQRKYSTKHPILLVTWFVMNIGSSLFFQLPTDCMRGF